MLNYRLLPERAPEVYQKIGVNFANVIILPAAQEVLKANTALQVANEMLRQWTKIKLDVQETLATWLAKYGVELKEAALANIRFDKAYEKAIKDK
jgi:prohibitin 2